MVLLLAIPHVEGMGTAGGAARSPVQVLAVGQVLGVGEHVRLGHVLGTFDRVRLELMEVNRQIDEIKRIRIRIKV